MPTLTYNDLSWNVDHAVKGADFVHGYASDGSLVVSIDGTTDFSNIKYTGTYLAPTACITEACNTVKILDGSLRRPDGTSLAPRDYGAAAAGFGYGESLVTIDSSTEEAFENALSAIASEMPTHSTKQVKAMLSFLSFTTFSPVEIYKHSSGNMLIATIHSPRSKGQSLQKVYASSAWQPIEWYNPAMVPGSEYRTIERYGSEPVYCKRIVIEHTSDVGSSDGLTLGQERIVHNLAFEKIVEINAFAYCADGDIVPFQISRITDTEFIIYYPDEVWKKPTYEIIIKYTKP